MSFLFRLQLKRRNSEGLAHALIGDYYIHGTMDGVMITDIEMNETFCVFSSIDNFMQETFCQKS